MTFIDSPDGFHDPVSGTVRLDGVDLRELRRRDLRALIGIVTQGEQRIKEMVDDVIEIPETLDFLTPILSVVPCQLLAYYCASFLGRDIDKPRNLAKSVTVE